MPIARGATAPDFTLPNQFGEEVRLSERCARTPVALVFFPLAFSHTCEGELCELRDNIEIFRAQGVELIGISVDSKHALRAWAEHERFDFDLLADFWPHGAVAQRYGVFRPERGFANRATFLLDGTGVVRSRIITDPGRPRSLGEYRRALEELSATA
ncbi:peroxiredoxin [Rathayibacter sp. YIM 133350]|uniref:peroxiredoxin n=1 Tax=Rathayibacter sp. YIM 133350 TaxID=3131992 RepID=UPI003FCF1F0B